MRISRRNALGLAVAGALAAAGAGLSTPAFAQTTYNIAGLADFTGPYADVMKSLSAGRWGVLNWWNEEVGKGIGVRVNLKEYDTRYDTAQTSSLWPGIKSELKPIAALGLGGPDSAALQQRLPDDKIPLMMATAAYGYAWRPDPWVFNPRATYAHEAGAFYLWYRQQKGITGTMKIGIISSEAAPAYVDIHKGLEKFISENKDKFELVETIFTEVQPSDLTTQVNRLVRKGAQVINIQTNTAAVVATKRALQALGRKDIPILMSSHNGLPASGKAAGGLAQMEGDYEVYGMAIASSEMTDTRKFYDMLVAKYKLTSGWDVLTMQGMNQIIYTLRAIEAAAKEVGPDKITGEAVRNAMFKHVITSKETFGVLPDLKFTKEAPFPLSGMTVNVGTVKDGKYSVAAQSIPVPAINKW